MSELAVMIENELDAMRSAPRKPATVQPSEPGEGSVIDRMVRAAMPSVILAGKVAQKRKAANERQRLADQEALNRSLIENTARDVANGDGVSYAESDPQFL
jgi:hypothetical protein